MERIRLAIRKTIRNWLGIGLQSDTIRLLDSYTTGCFTTVWKELRALGAEIDTLKAQLSEAAIDAQTQLAEANTEIDRLRMMISAEPVKKILKPRGWREAQELMQGTH